MRFIRQLVDNWRCVWTCRTGFEYLHVIFLAFFYSSNYREDFLFFPWHFFGRNPTKTRGLSYLYSFCLLGILERVLSWGAPRPKRGHLPTHGIAGRKHAKFKVVLDMVFSRAILGKADSAFGGVHEARRGVLKVSGP